MKKQIHAALTLMAVVPLCQNASAITTEESNATIRFNLSNPGARSLALGGAFIGLADDATASFTNPAGLVNLYDPEISIEYRHVEYSSLYTDRGRLFGTPSGNGIDLYDEIIYGDADSSVDSLSFISFVDRIGEFSYGIYRHQVANYETRYQSQGPILQDLGMDILRRLPNENSVDLDIASYALAGSYRVAENFSIGLTITYYDFSFATTNDRYLVPDGQETAEQDFSGTARFIGTQTGDDDSFGFNAGILWNISPQWNLGVAYRSGAEFDYSYQVAVNDNLANPFITGTTDFTLPDTLGFGLSWGPTDSIRINFDYNRVFYSDLADGLVVRGTGEPTDQLTLDDGNEYRLGAEYLFLVKEKPIALRAGVWRAPNTAFQYNGPLEPATLDDTPEEILEKTGRNTNAAFARPENDETHFSVGGGMVFNNFQLDFAFDFSDSEDTFSLSSVFIFR